MNTVTNALDLTGRSALAALFLIAGIGKLTAYAATQGYMESMGLPGVLLPLVIALEIGGAIALVSGFLTRLTALALAGFSVVSALIFHADFADATQQVMFLKNLSIAGGLLILAVHGARDWSIDHVAARRGSGAQHAVVA